MVATTTMTLPEVIILSAGWVLAIIAIIFHIFIWKFTHAWTFLRAWLRKMPIVRELDHGMARYICAKREDETTIELKNGYIIKTHNSHVFDYKSKVRLYDKYGDYAFSLDTLYNAIVGELRDAGFNIQNYDDLKDLIKLATDDAYASEFMKSVEDEETRNQVKTRIQTLKDWLVTIKPYKTYKLQDLSTMFPNNINTISNEHKVIALVDRNAKKQKFNVQLILYIGFGCLIVGFAVIMISKFIKDPTCPDVICNCARTGMEVVRNATQAIVNPQTPADAAKDLLIP